MEAQLRPGVDALGLRLSEMQVQQLLDYGRLLEKWAKVYNLTALRGPSEIVTHHLLDSLAVVVPLLRMCGTQALRVLDVGSGAGLPGAVIAIACPQIHVECVDSVAKKAAFIRQAAATLELPNLMGTHGRVEQLTGRYDVITSRAFASLADFVRLTRQALADGGLWMAMKGRNPADEAAALQPDVEMFHVEQLHVPGLGAERCLVWIRPRSA